MFTHGTITAYPTDTSFGLGCRADDTQGLDKLTELKARAPQKFYTLMVRDEEMLREYAEVPENFDPQIFFEKPFTVLLKPKSTLPKSKYWPEDKVGFRISTIPEVAQQIEYPITATSANISGTDPIFDITKIQDELGPDVQIFPGIEKLKKNKPSEIWDYTVKPAVRIR